MELLQALSCMSVKQRTIIIFGQYLVYMYVSSLNVYINTCIDAHFKACVDAQADTFIDVQAQSLCVFCISARLFFIVEIQISNTNYLLSSSIWRNTFANILSAQSRAVTVEQLVLFVYSQIKCIYTEEFKRIVFPCVMIVV